MKDRYREINGAALVGSKKCPKCAELVQPEAQVCRYCGFKFPPPPMTAKQGAGCIGVAVLAMLFVWQCSRSPRNDVNDGVQDYQVIAAGETGIKARLRDPAFAVFSGEHIGLAQGHKFLCGSVNSRNGFGGMTGADRFVAGGEVSVVESEAQDEFDSVWGQAGC